MEQIKTRRVLDVLQQKGDNLVEPRHTLHWIYFTDKAMRESFINAIADMKFDVIERLEAEDGQCGVRLEHVTSMLPTVINDVVYDIVRVASEHGGEYDGFETALIAGK